MCSYLKWQLNVEPSALKEFETIVWRDSRVRYPAHYTLPAPSSGLFAHPKPSTSNIPTAIPSFGPGAPPSPPSTATPTPTDKPSRRSSVDSFPIPTDPPQPPIPPASHSNVPSLANSMSPSPLPNCEGDSAKTVSSAGSNTMQISGNNLSLPYHQGGAHLLGFVSIHCVPIIATNACSLDLYLRSLYLYLKLYKSKVV